MKFLNAAFISVMLSTSLFANAGLILSDSTVINSSGQAHTQTFDVTGFENYTNLVFTVNARGDFGTGTNEIIEFFIDDTSFGEFNYNTPGVTSIIGPTGNSKYDYIIDFSFAITDADWTTIYANDSQIKVDWKNADAVGPTAGNYVNYSLSGDFALTPPPAPVSEPSTLAIFALGMIGLASRRFKKKS